MTQRNEVDALSTQVATLTAERDARGQRTSTLEAALRQIANGNVSPAIDCARAALDATEDSAHAQIVQYERMIRELQAAYLGADEEITALRTQVATLTAERDRLAINGGIGPISADVWDRQQDVVVELIRQRDAASREVEALRTSREWQPIATAPRDGENVLVVTEDDEILVGHWREYFGGGWDLAGSGTTIIPTHWQPLPAPPAEAAS